MIPQFELYNVYNLIANMTTEQINGLSFGNDTTTIFSGIDFVSYVKKNYAFFEFPSLYDAFLNENQNVLQATNDFVDTFGLWRSSHLNNFIRIFEGLNKDYNPIENYDRYEEGGWKDELHKGTRTTTNSDVTATQTGEVINNNYIVGEDSTTPTNTDKSVTSYDNATTRTQANADSNYTEISDISSDKFDYNKHLYEGYHIHGNIGVTTNAQMLTGEFELRKNSFIKYVMDDFVRSYLVYVGV